MKTQVTWTGEPPPDRLEWEAIVSEELKDVIGVCNIELRRDLEMSSWRLSAASCGGVSIGHGPGMGNVPPPLDVAPHVAAALAKAGKRVMADVLTYEPCPQCGSRLQLTADGNDDAMMLCQSASCGYSGRLRLQRS